MKDSVWYYFDNGPASSFFTVVDDYKKECLRRDDLHSFYIGWCNEIIFELNESNTFQAYKKTMEMARDMRSRKCDADEYFLVTDMLGIIYADCYNVEGAHKCFMETLERLEKSKFKDSDERNNIYLDLAYVEYERYPERAMAYVDSVIAHQSSEGVNADAYAFRGVLQFRAHQWDDFLASYYLYQELEKQKYFSIYGAALDMYYSVYQGNIDDALKKAEAYASVLDRLEYLKQIYEMTGDTISAYKVGEKLRHVVDSINGLMLTDNLQGISNELEIAEAEHHLDRQRIVILSILVGAATLFILALFYILHSRHRFAMHLQKKNEELTEARDHAMESDRMKTAFIQSVSHEIRTPLNIIGGFVQILADPSMTLDDATRKHMVEAMLKNTGQITGLVNEMLELSKGEAERLLDLNDHVTYTAIGHEAIAAVSRPREEGVELRFETTLADDAPLTTNRDALLKLLAALLDNAVKFTAKGHVVLRAEEGRFVVEDTGCGIPATEAEHIFERFVKLDEFKEGLGLGLPLSRQLARRMGGDVRLDLSYANGARFIVELP